MVFKINISHNGKTLKIETESEDLMRSKIGDKVGGSMIDPSLEGYELEITGTSDTSGFPGVKGQVGTQLRGILLTRNKTGMRNERKGLRLKKSVRGEEISEKTVQINVKVLKEGSKKFDSLLPKKESEATEGEAPQEKPAEEVKEKSKEEVKEESKDEVKEEKAADEEPKQDSISPESNPDEEPKSTEKQKKELANPDEEPKSD